MESELSGEIGAEGGILALGNFHLFPLETSNVGVGALRGGVVIQLEFEVLAFCCKRQATVVDQRAAISQLQPSDLQIKKILAPGVGSSNFWSGQVTVAVFIELYCKLWPVNYQFAQGKSPVEKRENRDSNVNTVCVEQWRLAGTLQSMECQIFAASG